MEQLAAQWPLLAGFLAIIAAVQGYAAKLVIGLYERMVTRAETLRDEAMAEAKADTEQRERLVTQNEALVRQVGDLSRVVTEGMGRQGQQMEALTRAIQELTAEVRRGERR